PRPHGSPEPRAALHLLHNSLREGRGPVVPPHPLPLVVSFPLLVVRPTYGREPTNLQPLSSMRRAPEQESGSLPTPRPPPLPTWHGLRAEGSESRGRPSPRSPCLAEVLPAQSVRLHLVVERPTVEARVLGAVAEVAVVALEDPLEVLALDRRREPRDDRLER